MAEPLEKIKLRKTKEEVEDRERALEQARAGVRKRLLRSIEVKNSPLLYDRA